MGKWRDYPSLKNPIYLLETQVSNFNFKKTELQSSVCEVYQSKGIRTREEVNIVLQSTSTLSHLVQE